MLPDITRPDTAELVITHERGWNTSGKPSSDGRWSIAFDSAGELSAFLASVGLELDDNLARFIEREMSGATPGYKS